MAQIKSLYGYDFADSAVRGSVAGEYSSSSTYAVGDMVLKEGQLYKCNTAISTAEAWTAAHWTAVTVGGELATVKDGFDDLDDRVTALEEGGSGSGLTEDIKQALLQLASKVAYIDEDGQDYYDALEEALYPPADLVSISAVYTQSVTVYDTDSLDSLKSDLVVTAHYSNQTTETITTYTLSGTLTEGTSTVTVSYGGKTTTFNVTVTGALYPLENGTHTFTTNSRVLTVSNGCEFLYEAPNATPSDSPSGAYLNLSKVSENNDSATAWSNIGNTDSDTPLFTIPANATVRLEVKNISVENIGSSTSSNNKWTVTLRGHQGTTKLSVVLIPDSLPTATEDTYAESVVTAATDVTCLYGYFRNPYKKFGATVYLYVNGVRWI